MNARTVAPVVVIAVALVVVLLGLFGLGGIVTGIVGIVAVLVIPGAVLAVALFPRRTLEPIEAVLVTLVGSIVIAILAGFVVTLVGVRLTTVSWAVALLAIALVMLGVARARGTQLRDFMPRRALRTPKPIDVALLGVAAAVVISAGAIAVFGATAQPEVGFTQAWILPGAGDTVRVGMADDQGTTLTYRAVLMGPSGTIGEWKAIQLSPGESWERSVSVPAAVRAGLQLVVYRSDAPTQPYRRVALGPIASGVPAASAPAPSGPASPGASPAGGAGTRPAASAAPTRAP